MEKEKAMVMMKMVKKIYKIFPSRKNKLKNNCVNNLANKT